MRLKLWILLAGAMSSHLVEVRAEDSLRVTVGSASVESANGPQSQTSPAPTPNSSLPAGSVSAGPFDAALGLATVPVAPTVPSVAAPILLQPIQSQSQTLGIHNTGLTASLDVIPMTRLASMQRSDAAGGPFRTADMIGPMGDATTFLSQWSTPDSNTFIPVEPLPVVRGYHQDPQTVVGWAGSTYPWISPVFYYHPLYFEQPNLERYGNGTHPIFQPALSSAHFFSSIALVPYKTLTHHPREKVYTLGTLRPGNCNPSDRHTLIGQSRVGEVLHYWHPNSGY